MRQLYYITLRYPPSCNRLWRAVDGRMILSAKYRSWKEAAGVDLRVQKAKRVAGPVKLTVFATPPDKRKRDLSNVCKAVEDLLVEHEIIDGDDMDVVKAIDLRVSKHPAPGVVVQVEALPCST